MMLPMLFVAAFAASPQELPTPVPPPAQEQPTTSAAPSESAASDIGAGLAAYRKRQFRQARAAFERAVAADPQSAAAHFYLGYTIYKIAEPRRRDSAAKREALDHFAEAFKLDPKFRPSWGG